MNDGAATVSRSDRMRPRVKTLGLAVLLAVAGGLVAQWSLDLSAAPSPFRVPWFVLAGGFVVTEVFVIRLHVRRESHSVTLSELPFMLGLAMASPMALVAGRLTGSVVALVFHRRSPFHRVVFNAAQFFLETMVAVGVYRSLLDGSAPTSLVGAGVALLALVCAFAVGGAAVAVVVAVDTRSSLVEAARALVAGSFVSLGAAVAAVGGTLVAWRHPVALVVFVAVGVALYGALHVYGTLNQRFADLEAVYAFTASIDRAADTDELLATALRELRDLTRARFSEVVLSRGITSTAASFEGDEVSLRPAPPDLLEAIGEVLGDGGTVEVRTLAELPATIRDHYEGRGVRSALAAFMAGGSGTSSMVVVADPPGSEVFDSKDAKLFDTLARQARVALERGRLVDRLRHEVTQKEHQALHDGLTGLPNRLQFTVVVERLLRQARQNDTGVAVLLVDLDRFKEVNDTLGHQRGDVLLQEMGLRLSELAGGDELLARLGGDEFGVAIADLDGVGDAVEWAQRISTALHRPFVNEGLTIQVSGSIGIALAPEHGTDGTTLLRRADVAMYHAKTLGSGFEVYDPQRDGYSTRRLAMAAELRTAIDEGELMVHYQPKASLADGRIVGVEALARWNHPRHGPVPPDEFILLAERTGLIDPLTEHVLRTALRDHAQLRREGHRVGVAVNIAAASLSDDTFPSLVERLIHEFDTEPQLLTLEVTETSMMTDSARARLVLNALDELGVRLSIDDFGTGYSSLTYLIDLPVDEVKIDRSFVMDMAVDDRLSKIVSSTTGLAHSLGLSVVAEGVENQRAWDLLDAAGCEIAQGYHLARPMPFGDLVGWLADRPEPVVELSRHDRIA